MKRPSMIIGAVELREIIKIAKKNFKAALSFSLLLSVVTVILSFQVPTTYKASASIYVKRQAETETPDFFSYEGFYAAQTAEKYTDTVIGLLKSIDLRRQALEKMGILPTSRSLSDLERAVVVKRTGPQLIFLSVKGENRKWVQDSWISLSESVIGRVSALNKNGDEKLFVESVEKSPVITEARPEPLLFWAFGFALGVFASAAFISFKEYLK